MLSRAVNGFTASDVDDAFKGKNRPPRYRARADLYDKDRNFIRALTNLIVEGSETQHVWDADIQRTGRVRIREADIELDDYVDLVVDDAPLFYWRLGDSSGTVAADASGNGRTGTYNGSPTLSAPSLLEGAQENTAVVFDGVNDYVSIADAAWMDGITTAGTWEVWLKTTASGALIYMIDRDNTTTGSAWQFRLTSSGQVQLVLFSALNTVLGFATGPVVNDGFPHHVVATWDGTTIRYYIDGIRTTSSAVSGTIPNIAVAINVGRSNAGTGFFTGTIDEVAVYSRALSAQEVREHYQKGADDLRETFLTDRLKLYIAIEMDSNGTDGTPYAEWPVAELLLQNPRRIATETGVILEADAFDQNVLLANHSFAARYSVAAGTNYITAIQTVLTTVGFAASQFTLTPTSLTLPAAREWDAGTSALQVINDLLQAINYQLSGGNARFRFNGEGMGIAEPYALPHTRSDEYTYDTDEHSVIQVGVEQELKLIRIPNKVVLTRADPGATNITGTATNNAVESNASVPNTGQTVTRTAEVPAADQSTITALAQRDLTEGTEAMRLAWTHNLAPWIDNADRVRFIHSFGGPGSLELDDSFIITEWRMPLDEIGNMSCRAKQVVKVV